MNKVFWIVSLLMLGTAKIVKADMASTLAVYTCDENKLIQSYVVSNDIQHSKSLLRAGHAIWADGRVDQSIVHAIAEGRGIWAAAPITTLAQLAGTDVPAEVLTAIANKESGVKGRFWPWTINFQGRGIYLHTKEQAVETAKTLISKGVDNFDVSLMQINWRWHKHRFKNIESAFDPINSLQVAGLILKENMQSTGSWHAAIARYHSRTETRGKSYLRGVISQLEKMQVIKQNEPEKKLCSGN